MPMDGVMILSRAGAKTQVAELVRVRVHTACEACRETARDRSDARAAGASVSGSLVARDIGEMSLEGLFRSKQEAPSADGLTEAERAMVQDLSARDQEVRRHEEAHARVGGEFAGQPSYTYQTGPDGQRYAIGGEVPIDVAPVPGDPEATIVKMEVVKRAALAPAEPSDADRRIAALADAQRLQALAELNASRGLSSTGADRQTDALVASANLLARGPETEPGQRLSLNI